MKNKNLVFEVQKVDVSKLDDTSFLGIKLWAISEGLNRNDVDFTLSSIENCIPTIYNKPILAAFNKSTEAFEGHNDLGIKTDDDGDFYVDYDSGFMDGLSEKPVGLIPLDSKIQIEKYKNKNWLTFTGLVWVKYSHKAVKLLKKLGKEKISVEVTLTDWEENEDGVIVVNAFVFDGVTVIGVPEGIEGAHLKLGQFSQSEEFGQYQKAFMFAYKQKDENKEEEKPPEIGKNKERNDDKNMKFDLKGMGLNDFHKKMYAKLEQYTYVGEDGDQRYKYWLVDIFPDNNYVILEDNQNRVYVKVPFVINDDRNIELDVSNQEEVVGIEVGETVYKTSFDFYARLKNSNVQKDNKTEGEAVVMDVKFKTLFVEKGYTPICKFDKFVLFTKQEEEGKVYRLEFDLIDKQEEEKFEELIAKFEELEMNNSQEENKEEMILKSEFDSIVAQKGKLEEEVKHEKEKCATLEMELTGVKQELTNVKEKCAEFEFEKFKVEARAYVESFGESFGEEKDIFKKSVFDKIDNKEITNQNALKLFVSEQLLEHTEKRLKQKDENFGLLPDKDPTPKNNKAKGDSVLTWM